MPSAPGRNMVDLAVIVQFGEQKRKVDSSRLRFLRWAGVVAPAVFIALITYVAHYHVPGILSREVIFALTVGVTTAGAFLFSNFVFGQIEKREREILRRSRELVALHAVSEVVSGSLELDAILIHTLKKVLEVTHTEAAEIFLLDEAAGELRLAVHRGVAQEAFQEVTCFRLGEGLPGRVAASGQTVLVHNLADEPRFIRQAVRTLGFQSYACVPLRAQDRVVGVMDVADRRARLTADDLNLLTAIGNQIGVAVDNARLYAHAQQTADYLNALIESSGDAMITVDLDGRITSWNRGAEEIYGWSKEEAIGQFVPMVPPDQREVVLAMLGQMRAGQTFHNLEVVRQRKDGALLEVIVTASPLRNAAGQIIGFLGISKDISELKRLQRALLAQRHSLAVLEERERIGMDLHDGVSQSLYSVGLRLESCLALITTAPGEAIRRLEQVTDDVTDIIGQIRNYVFDLRAHRLHGRRLTEGLAELAQELRDNTMMQVEVAADDAARAVCERLSEAQATNLFLIAREALANILKHARASAVIVGMAAHDGRLCLTVKDDGIGFDPDAKLASDGHGLGNMTERAALLGARLHVESRPGAGTVIALEIGGPPVAPPAAPENRDA